MVAYKVLSIYRVLPGFREFAVFERSKRFFIFFGWALQKGVRALARARIHNLFSESSINIKISNIINLLLRVVLLLKNV